MIHDSALLIPVLAHGQFDSATAIPLVTEDRTFPPRGASESLSLPPFTFGVLTRLKKRVRSLQGETFTLYLAARHPGTPWYGKLFVAAIVAYAFSPIDLIPDFIPILGYVDDLILIPMGIALASRCCRLVLVECRVRAQEIMSQGTPVSRIAGAVIAVIWIVLAALAAVWVHEAFGCGDTSR